MSRQGELEDRRAACVSSFCRRSAKSGQHSFVRGRLDRVSIPAGSRTRHHRGESVTERQAAQALPDGVAMKNVAQADLSDAIAFAQMQAVAPAIAAQPPVSLQDVLP